MHYPQRLAGDVPDDQRKQAHEDESYGYQEQHRGEEQGLVYLHVLEQSA